MKELNGSRSQKTNGIESNDIMAKVNGNLQSLIGCSTMIPYAALSTLIFAGNSFNTDIPLKTCGLAISVGGTILAHKKIKKANANLKKDYSDLGPTRKGIKNLNADLSKITWMMPIVSPVTFLTAIGICSTVINPDLKGVLNSVAMTGVSFVALCGLGRVSVNIENNFLNVIADRGAKSK